MFEHLSGFGVILVTGPQRSGTTICAKMIASDTGHRYVDEAEYDVHDVDKWWKIVLAGRRIVVQCPAMCHLVHKFGGCDDVLIVLMRRDANDIRGSQERIGWIAAGEDAREVAKYRAKSGPSAMVKYLYWDTHQRERIQHKLEVDYEGLRAHPMWVSKNGRVGWHVRQTSNG